MSAATEAFTALATSSATVITVDMSAYLWIPIAASIVAFVMACGIGANDVANAFASSVGAGSLTLKQAVMLGAVFEFAGAFLMGAHVTDTVRKGITDVDRFLDQPEILMLGMFSALIGAASWLMIATSLGVPVSTTHSIIGGIIGFALCAEGSDGVNWGKVGLVVASWFISPAMSGIFAMLIFYTVRKVILRPENSVRRAYIFFPINCFLMLWINAFFIIYKGSPRLKLKKMNAGAAVGIASGIAAGLTAIVWLLARNKLQSIIDNTSDEEETHKGDVEMGGKKAQKDVNDDEAELSVSTTNISLSEDSDDGVKKPHRVQSTSPAAESGKPSGGMGRLNRDIRTDAVASSKKVANMHASAEKFPKKTEALFKLLQVCTAIFDSFAHGANDVANAIGPLAACVYIYQEGRADGESEVPLWVLALGGGGIVIGLATFGYKVISSIGVKLTVITPSRGFGIELGAAVVVLFASRIGIPVSTTHCQVGATVGIGMLEKRKDAVNWSLLAKVALSWVITLIFAGVVTSTFFSFAAFAPEIRRD